MRGKLSWDNQFFPQFSGKNLSWKIKKEIDKFPIFASLMKQSKRLARMPAAADRGLDVGHPLIDIELSYIQKRDVTIPIDEVWGIINNYLTIQCYDYQLN